MVLNPKGILMANFYKIYENLRSLAFYLRKTKDRPDRGKSVFPEEV